MQEAEYLDTIYPHTELYQKELSDLRIAVMKKRYETNSKMTVGQVIECPVCHRVFLKTSYNQKFDSTRCKDRYWNTVKPRGIFCNDGGRRYD